MEDLIKEITQGNWGAETVIAEMQKEFGPISSIYFSFLKELDIVGPRLWILYKYVSMRDIVKMMELVMNIKVRPNIKINLDGKETEVLSYITNFPGTT